MPALLLVHGSGPSVRAAGLRSELSISATRLPNGTPSSNLLLSLPSG